MVLVKLILDGTKVLQHAWAGPNAEVGKTDTVSGQYTYYEVASQAEIDACVDGHTQLLDGHLVVDADYVAPVQEQDPLDAGPSAQDQINATLMKQIAAQTTTNAAMAKELAEIKAGMTTEEG